MKAAIYTATKIGNTGGVPAFNAFAFPCHDPDVDTIYLNGHFPDIEELCLSEGLKVLPFSKFRVKSKTKET